MIDIDRKSDPYPPTMGAMARLVLELRAAGEPISISINGRGLLPITDEESIRRLFDFVDEMESVEALRPRIERLDRGEKSLSLEEEKQELNRRHGTSI